MLELNSPAHYFLVNSEINLSFKQKLILSLASPYSFPSYTITV